MKIEQRNDDTLFINKNAIFITTNVFPVPILFSRV